MLVDRFGRVVENLRISVTSRCNLDCIFCHAEGYTPTACNKARKGEMNLNEIILLVKVAAKHGIKSVKLTGGEPLLRWDITEIVKGIKSISGIEEVSMVSNGILLAPLAKKLAEAGLDRINVSLHTLNKKTYAKITGSSEKNWDRVVEGIEKAKDFGIGVKINVAVLKGFNDGELFDLIDFAKENEVNIQFIEYHSPYFIRPEFKRFFFSLAEFEKELEKIADRVYVRKMHHRRRFVFGKIYVETVRPIFNADFCANCTRLRVIGYEFKPCLMRSDNHVSFEHAFEAEDPEREIEKALFEAVARREPFFK